MNKLLAVLLVLIPAVVFALGEGGIQGGGGSGTTNASDLSSGTLPAARIGDNSVTNTKLLDNTILSGKIGDGTIVAGDIADNTITNDKLLDATLDLAGTKHTGVLPKASGGFGASVASQSGIPYFVTGTTNWDTLAAFLARYGVTYNPADNSWTFPGTITFNEAVSTCVPADNNCGQTATNVGSPSGANLSAGLQWFDNTTQCFMIRNNDNTANITMSCLTKTFSFGIDNVIDGDDIFVWMDLPRAITITKITCFASTDNVIGVLQECTAGDVTSCTDVDDTDWTIGGETLQTTATAYDSGFENAAIAAGTHLKWITTSEGTTNSNKLSCTMRYTE